MATRSNDFSFSSLPYPTVDLSDLPVVDQAMMVEIDRVMEHDLGIALIQMMENAGRCLARLARSALPDPRFAVSCDGGSRRQWWRLADGCPPPGRLGSYR